jgi:hypothetical protein
LFHLSVLHIVLPPQLFHTTVSSNDVYAFLLLRTRAGL